MLFGGWVCESAQDEMSKTVRHRVRMRVMKNFTKTFAIALIALGATAGGASADNGRFGLSIFERGKLRMSYFADRNHDGRVTAEEVLLTRPDAFDRDGDGILNAAERGVALQRLRRHRFD